MEKAEELLWKWSVPIKWSAINYSILEGFDYKIVPDNLFHTKVERLEIYLPIGKAKDVVRYLRDLGLAVGIEYGTINTNPECFDKNGVYYGGGGSKCLFSPLLDEFGRLKPEYL